MIVRRTLSVLVASALVAVFLGGCLFSPRDPDGPPDEEPTDWQTPISTSIVLQNLKAAFEGEGLSNYRECFVDTFRFHVDPQDSLDAGQEGYERYANWTRDDEEYAASRIFSDAAGIALSFTTIEEPDETQDVTYRRESYVLTIEWQSGPHVPNEEITYEGWATLWMRRDDTGRWAIFRWVDRRPDPHVCDTWGVLRGDYRA